MKLLILFLLTTSAGASVEKRNQLVECFNTAPDNAGAKLYSKIVDNCQCKILRHQCPSLPGSSSKFIGITTTGEKNVPSNRN